MTGVSGSDDFDNVWARVIEILSNTSGTEWATPRLLSWLRQVRPKGLMGTIVVLSVPNAMAKEQIENHFSAVLEETLSQVLGYGVSIALSIERTATSEPSPEPAPEPTPEPPARGHQQELNLPTPIAESSTVLGTPGPTNPALKPNARFGEPIQAARIDFEKLTNAPHPPAAPPQDSFQKEEPEDRGNIAHFLDIDLVSPGEAASNAAPSEGTQAQTAAVEDPQAASDPDILRPQLNPQYTFEAFVAGSSNRYAYAAAVSVAEYPAATYNPLFIWGDSGLGKTHLLHAIGEYALRLRPHLRVRYVSTEEFTNEWINSLRDKNGESFKRKYRDLDILIVDDVQFLAGKEGTQEEFFHTFNALFQAGKQIVLSSDRPPKDLNTLEDRLRTRFEGGLITDIQIPDLETRMAILSLKAKKEGEDVPYDVLDYIASQNVPSVRELEGLLTRVCAIASLDGSPVTLELAQDALKGLVSNQPVEILPKTIVDATADFFDISLDELLGTTKARKVATARQVAMYLVRELTDLSLPKIGDQFGGRDHSTVLYATRKVAKEMQADRKLLDHIQELTNIIKERSI